MTCLAKAAAVVSFVCASSLAFAQSPAEKAEELSAQAKESFAQQDYASALAKFREALVLSPLPKYHFNLCLTLTKLERMDEARNACETVVASEASARLKDKARRLLETMAKADKREEIAPGESPNQSRAKAQPEEPKRAKPDSLSWGLGIDLALMPGHSIGGEFDLGQDRYGDGATQLRIYGEWISRGAARFGSRVYLARAQVPSDVPGEEDLSIIDIGFGGMKHFHVVGNLYFTPFFGFHYSLLGPADSPTEFTAFGGRLEATLNYAIDRQGQHMVGALAGYTYWGGSSGSGAADLGVDQGNSSFTMGLGYSFRFASDGGQHSWLTLE